MDRFRIKNRFAMTLIEIVIAVGVLGVAIVPIVGMIQRYLKQSVSIGGKRDYIDRSKNLMENLLENVSFREIQRFNDVQNADVDDRTTTVVEDLSEIRTRNPINAGAVSAEVTIDSYNPDHYIPLINVYDKDDRDTPIDSYVVKGGKTFFRYKMVNYYFKLEITNIPLVMSFKSYFPNPGEIIKERVLTRDVEGNLRDMFKKLVIKVDWEDYGMKQKYSLVSFRANVETAFDNE